MGSDQEIKMSFLFLVTSALEIKGCRNTRAMFQLAPHMLHQRVHDITPDLLFQGHWHNSGGWGYRSLTSRERSDRYSSGGSMRVLRQTSLHHLKEFGVTQKILNCTSALVFPQTFTVHNKPTLAAAFGAECKVLRAHRGTPAVSSPGDSLAPTHFTCSPGALWEFNLATGTD